MSNRAKAVNLNLSLDAMCYVVMFRRNLCHWTQDTNDANSLCFTFMALLVEFNPKNVNPWDYTLPYHRWRHAPLHDDCGPPLILERKRNNNIFVYPSATGFHRLPAWLYFITTAQHKLDFVCSSVHSGPLSVNTDSSSQVRILARRTYLALHSLSQWIYCECLA